MKRLAILIGLILPLQASALEYRNLSLLYTDAPFNPAEAAGISLLTSIGAIDGYPDGTFKPSRTLNRAEFLKIALASYPEVRVALSDAADCFPDVQQEDWFSQYVCLAKKRGMVSGYPDGEFKPSRTVNYAEALKILGELYNYVAYSADDEEWYAGYVRAAQFNKTALPSSIKFDRPLTRGQMARLAAAYRANYEGEIEMYRLSEKSFDLVVQKEIAQKKQEEELREDESESDESEDTSPQEINDEPLDLFPAMHRFLLLGSSYIIATANFAPRDEVVHIRNATVQFRDEVENIAGLYLVDESGERIAELHLDTFDQDNRTWKTREDIQSQSIPAVGAELGIEAQMKDRSQGFPEELIQVKWVSLNVSSISSNESYQLIGGNTSYPAHQTATARIRSVQNNRPPILDIGQGENILLAEFIVEGQKIEDSMLKLNHLTFTLSKKQGVLLSNLTLGAFHSTEQTPCSTEGSSLINCNSIPLAIGSLDQDQIIIQLFGTIDVDETASDPILQIDLLEPGVLSTSIEPGIMGHVRWTDGQGAYNWVELEKPVAEGSVWK